MKRRLVACLCLSIVGVVSIHGRVAASEPSLPGAPTAIQLAIHHYAYVNFPRRIQAADDAIALAELNVSYWQARVDGYRPFRSFGRYGATYSADRAVQLQLLAAQQELACLMRDKGDLWRQRQAVAQAALIGQAPAGQKSQPR